ncbi:hypothetical protein [Alkalihalobacillus pseudalcaliphilus]|uniref:hypothetical protein n=1 Tax=Alkalihalobacillus pseudalcaliphilus TaxID=79884 RepID=UPI00064E11C7|nr:hypothetical protein [Alkalihalobacillus pseudalcaliphilus]KMK74586.1 hypothetical protein AB990_18960 [Alkalihalobacillus pseudalcaliphilus]
MKKVLLVTSAIIFFILISVIFVEKSNHITLDSVVESQATLLDKSGHVSSVEVYKTSDDGISYISILEQKDEVEEFLSLFDQTNLRKISPIENPVSDSMFTFVLNYEMATSQMTSDVSFFFINEDYMFAAHNQDYKVVNNNLLYDYLSDHPFKWESVIEHTSSQLIND